MRARLFPVKTVQKTETVGKKSALPKWEVEHQRVFAEMNCPWPRVAEPSPSNEFTRGLSERAKQCLVLDELKHARHKFSTRIVMLGQSIQRNYGSNDKCPCIVPNGDLWERGRQAPVWGWEQLAFQGLELPMVPAVRNFPNSLLVDMAGDL